MNYKWIGAICVLLSCGGCGFSMAASYQQEERMYRNLIQIIQYMRAELQYRLTSLPELCEKAGNEMGGSIGAVFICLSEELKKQVMPDTASCMRMILSVQRKIPTDICNILMALSKILGRFDLEGQIQGLDSIKASCEQALSVLQNHREERLRGYQTLGLCAGAALVILFI